MINFPFYVIRPYLRIFEEGNYKIIETHKNRYVLDYVASKIGSYPMRRVALLSETDKPYGLYRIKYIITSMSQIISSKYKLFLDAAGTLIRWNPKEFAEVSCHRITSRWQTQAGHYAIKLDKVPTTFTVTDANYNYAQVVRIGRTYILYDLCNEMRKSTRKKI